MPQLDPNTFSPQLVWLAIAFVALYLIMAKVALPKVGEVLDERQRRIEDSLERATELEAEARAVAEAYEASLAEARSRAQDAIKAVRDAAAGEAAQRQADLGEKLAADVQAAESRIAGQRDEAFAGLRDMAVEVAREAAAKLVGQEADAAAAGRAVDAVLEERG
ncbi:MAG: F0F1 ATP synthase subunit B' [Hyphomicrobiales bacterium]|nr:F0F1 ATP synthase subunit B' [Hyphomicrobiales bacterium]